MRTPFKACAIALSLLTVAAATDSARAAELGVLAPVMEQGQPLEKAGPHGIKFPVVTRVTHGPMFDLLQKEATQGCTALVLALDEIAQRRAAATTPTPTWLYLSEEDGGFARQGFWLREAGPGVDQRAEKDRFVPDAFVDLVVDEETVGDGGFEEIFAHEMGHVFLRRLLPTLPQGFSRTPHGSLTVTDNPTAFDEGFAIHFQGLARRITRNEALRNQDLGLVPKAFVPYWASNIDRTARIDGVRRNVFVQAQITMPGGGDALVRRDLSTLFNTARLKNGNQMMASEGVIATLFYQWLVPGSAEQPALLERYSRLFEGLVALNKTGTHAPDSPFFLDLLDVYPARDARERKRLLVNFIGTTYGATADRSLTPRFEALAALGRVGNPAFIDSLKDSRAALEKLTEQVTKSPAQMRAALGPAIWLFVEAQSFAVNLNTAEREHLEKLPGLGPYLDRALESRRAEGPFIDVADFGRRAGLDGAAVAQLEALARAMHAAGAYPRK
jgi:hypothetical protein